MKSFFKTWLSVLRIWLVVVAVMALAIGGILNSIGFRWSL